MRFPEGVEVFLDLNNNGARDNDEPFTLTDANGQYKFKGLAPGEYTVCIEKPIGARELDSQSDLVQWTSATRYHGNSANFSLAAQSKRFDYNSDGKADLVMRNDATGQNEIWLMDGLKRIGIQELPALNGNWKMVGTADLDGNGERDILWHNTNSGANVVWMYQGGERLSYALEPVGSQWELVGSGGDWNNDGRDDLVWYNKNTGDTTIWYMRSYYHRGAKNIARVANLDWKIAVVADFNGQGAPELLWKNDVTTQGIYWRYDDANSQWQMKQAPHMGLSGWKIASVADLNADGVLEIIWNNGDRNAVWLLNFGGQQFPVTAVYGGLLA